MKTRYSLLFSFMILSVVATELLAQPGRGRGMRPPGGVISGSVVDGKTGEGLPGATIALWNSADSSLVTGMAADINGDFALENMRPGSYYLKVSSLGYLTQVVPGVELKGVR